MQQSLTPTPPPPGVTQDLPIFFPSNPPTEGNNDGKIDDSTLVYITQPSPPPQRTCLCDQPSRSDDEIIQFSYICSQAGRCSEQFYKRCLINHGYRPPYDIHPYFCMRYFTKPNPQTQMTLMQTNILFGLSICSNVHILNWEAFVRMYWQNSYLELA